MVDKLFDIASKKGISIELFKTRIKNSSIKMFQNELENYETSDVNSYNIKAKIKNKVVSANFDNLNNPEYILEILEKNAETIDEETTQSFSGVEERIDGSEQHTRVSLDKVIQDFKELYKLKTDHQYIDTILLTFTNEYVHRELKNTNGVSLKDSSTLNEFGFELVINVDGVVQTNYGSVLTKDYDVLMFKAKLIEAIKDTYQKIKAKSYLSNKYNIILKNECVYDLLFSLSSMFFEESIEKGISPLSDSFEKKVFSPKITIIEDPNNEKYVGKRLFDNEGTLTYFKNIVENGVFKTKLYDNKYASKNNTTSTGNGFGVRNMYIKPGQKNFDQLLQELNAGILIDNIEGLHSGIDKITGNISLQAEGYLIENGKKTTPLNLIILSTNIFELLNNVIEVGNDLEFFSINGGAPSLLLKDISITGKE